MLTRSALASELYDRRTCNDSRVLYTCGHRSRDQAQLVRAVGETRLPCERTDEHTALSLSRLQRDLARNPVALA
jgi:hypothetical protein